MNGRAHIETSPVEGKLLNILQKEFPITERPFHVLGRRLGISEREVINLTDSLFSRGIIRQISAIFDSRRLGYRSSLIAMEVPSERLDEVAYEINKHPGVSHNYSRKHRFNLWFTIAVPPHKDLHEEIQGIANKVSISNILILPSIKVFKIGVVLDVAGEQSILAREKRVSNTEDIPLSPLTEFDKEVIRGLQENIAVTERPFKMIAERLGIDEEKLFSVAHRFLMEGRMRRFAAILRHRKAGFKANAMVVWNVPSTSLDRTGKMMASFKAVTHCYQRPSFPPLWPYNLFTMIHSKDIKGCTEIVQALSRESGINNYEYLMSEKEYKKMRIKYFVE